MVVSNHHQKKRNERRKIMPFITFEGFNFTVIVDGNGEPWWIAKELFNYLEQGRDTLIRSVGGLSGKWHFFLMFRVKISFEYHIV